ncbi:cathepsin B-like [Armigeres subalbatus]|uniref:cathepsin B-like n=1 Tax=Armigeres subalbatus TaxID=124917 RepID=UPI002ED58F04
MKVHRIVFVLFVSTAFAGADPDIYEDNLTRDEFIAAINSRAKTWKAGINQGPEPVYMTTAGSASEAELRMLDPDPMLSRPRTDDLPETFDARDHWPECPSLREVRNQGCCASCYAVSVAAAMTDRWCIQSNGTQQHTFSSQDVASCCVGCGDCTGGYPHRVWWHWRSHGVVSGGEFDSGEGCRPYEVDACVYGEPEPEELECVQQCRIGHPVGYEADKRYAVRSFHVLPEEEMIMWNIYLGGPVSATFQIYSDFSSYRSGVYRHTSGRHRGLHIVKLLGWGIENGTKYWLLANTWGSDWGDGGFVKFLRGENHLGIESEVFGGNPRYD